MFKKSKIESKKEIFLDAGVRMGEILEEIPNKATSSRQGTRSLPDDVTRKQSHQAQTLSKNRDIVEQAKADARENGEIVTASKVYQIMSAAEVTENVKNFTQI